MSTFPIWSRGTPAMGETCLMRRCHRRRRTKSVFFISGWKLLKNDVAKSHSLSSRSCIKIRSAVRAVKKPICTRHKLARVFTSTGVWVPFLWNLCVCSEPAEATLCARGCAKGVDGDACDRPSRGQWSAWTRRSASTPSRCYRTRGSCRQPTRRPSSSRHPDTGTRPETWLRRRSSRGKSSNVYDQ